MNKNLLFSFFLGSLLLVCASCSKDGNDIEEITLNRLETYQLSGGGTWRSENSFVAVVSESGLILGSKVGSAIVYNSSTRVKVNVKARHTLYDNPYMVWGASKSTLKSKIGNPFDDASSNGYEYLYYDGPNSIVPQYTYIFQNNKLISSGVFIYESGYSDLAQHLDERYEYYGYDSGFYVYANGNSQFSPTLLVMLTNSSTPGYKIVWYEQITPSSSDAGAGDRPDVGAAEDMARHVELMSGAGKVALP